MCYIGSVRKEDGYMEKDKLYLINKIFNDKKVRTVWNKESEKYYVSIIDIIEVLTGSARPRKYWSDLKKQLTSEGSEVSEKIGQLKLKATDGKYRLTNVWKENGIEGAKEYAILTNEIYKTWPGMTSKEYKECKGLRKENLRDNMDSIELILTDLSEEVTKRLAEEHKPVGLDGNIKVAKVGGNASEVARCELESNLGESIITSSNGLDYEYDDKEMITQK